MGLHNPNRDREPLPWGLRGDQVNAGLISGREGERLAGFSSHLGWGGMSAPADRIHRPAEVSPSGVGLCATRHPVHGDGLLGGRGCSAGHIPTGILSEGHRTDPLGEQSPV